MHKNTVVDVLDYVYQQVKHIQVVLQIIQQDNVYKNVHQSLIIFQIIQREDVYYIVHVVH